MTSDNFKFMSPDERRRILNEKIKANAQRRMREAYLEYLPQPLGAYLSGCDFFTTPDLDDMASLFRFPGRGFGKEVKIPSDYVYSEFSWLLKRFEAIKRIQLSDNNIEAYFQPSGNPIYRVDFRFVQKNLEYFYWSPSQSQWGLVAKDLSKGILLSHYGGYLPEDLNLDEIVYELGYWGLTTI